MITIITRINKNGEIIISPINENNMSNARFSMNNFISL